MVLWETIYQVGGWKVLVCVYVCVEVLLFYRGWSKRTFEQKSESKEQAI